MSSSLSSLADNLTEGLHNDKSRDCKSCLERVSTKDKLLIFKCLKCNKNYEKEFNQDLIKRFANMYGFCDGDINKFILLLKKGIYPYEYMDSWKRSNKILLLNKKDFYSDLNMEDITYANYMHANKVWKTFKTKKSS